MSSLRVIDLFAGAGGLSEGFREAGFEIVAAVDNNEDFLETHKHNHPDSKHINADLMSADPAEVLEENNIDKSDIDMVIGGPPCKGFSIAGERREDDERNNLVDKFIDWVEYIEPQMFLMENVTGILTMNDGEVVELVMDRFEELGYSAKFETLNSARYGVPQTRRRVIFLGRKDGNPPRYPSRTHYIPDKDEEKENLEPAESVKDHILERDFSEHPNHEKTNHSEDMVSKLSELDYEETPYDSYGDSWKRLHPEKPSITIKENHNAPFVHPEENRVGTVRECATLQSFPLDYEFKGSKSSQLKQVGNAVPPKLAKRIAETVKPQLREIKKSGRIEETKAGEEGKEIEGEVKAS